MLIQVRVFPVSFLWRLLKSLNRHIGILIQSCFYIPYGIWIWKYLPPPLIFPVTQCLLLCSHKAKVLDFLDQLCAFYEQEYVHASSVVAESNEAFIDKVCDLADANALSSKMLRIWGFRVVCAIELLPEEKYHLFYIHAQNWNYKIKYTVSR